MKKARRGRRGPTAAVLGLGKAGGALLASLREAAIPVSARARRLPTLLRQRGLADAELLFLAIPDDALAATAARLATLPKLPPVVVHLSGSRGLAVLAPLLGRCATASFHPLASLDGKHPIPRGTLFAWDASDTRAARQLAALARRLHGVPVRVRDDARALYHAGAVVAGNLPVALLHEGIALLMEAGVPEATARVALARLLRSQAENAERQPLARALSGPVARGDADTLARHLALLDGLPGARRRLRLAALYRELSGILVDDVAAHRAPAADRLRAALGAKHR
ncbi:MAG: DUF2520 domain-containing protein [Deltaproteobacteria bacterium]|nr:DUF2520 domain-containing protein [Deltaproteobacteria bacterium]